MRLFSLIILALRDVDIGSTSTKASQQENAQISSSQSSENKLQVTKIKQIESPKYKALDGSPLDPDDFRIPDVEERPWYMKVNIRLEIYKISV